MRLIRKTILTLLSLLFVFAPSLSLAEGDYEEGDGWEYQDGVLKVTSDEGLHNLYNSRDSSTDNSYSIVVSKTIDVLVIGKNVTHLDFRSTDWNFIPKRVQIEDGSATFQVDRGWVIDKKTHTLICPEIISYSETVAEAPPLPEGIEYIGPDVLLLNQFAHITFPVSLIGINESAFYGCESLITVELPENLKSVGTDAFNYCVSLERAVLSASTKYIGERAFYSCYSLEEVNLQATGIRTLQSDSLAFCIRLVKCELPQSLTEISTNAFSNCIALERVIIQSNEIVIHNNAFNGCGNLHSIIFTKGTPAYFGETLFGETGKTPEGKGYISNSSDHRGEIIPYPTLYYTEAYAAEWAPNGETEWNGYPIQQISQAELDAVLAQARGEELPAATPAPTTAPLPTVAPDAVYPSPARETSLLDGWMIAAIAAVVLAAGVVVVGAVRSSGKKR